MRKIKNDLRIWNLFFCCISFFPLTSFAKEQPSEFYSTSVTAMYGQGNITQKDQSSLVEKKKRKIDWKESTFKTDNLTSLRITDLNSGVWSILPSSQFKILDTAEQMEDNPFKHSGKLLTGILRFKASGVPNSDTKKINLTVETDELKVFVPAGSDVVLLRKKESPQGKYITSVYSLNGTIYFLPNSNVLKEKGKVENKQIPIGPGVVFSISEDGTIAPLVAPNAIETGHILAFTTTAEEIFARKHYADGYNINELLQKCSEFEKSGDYFEILNLFEPFKTDFKNNAKIPYCIGIASEGLSQKDQAIKYFKDAIHLDANNMDAHWHLAQLYLQEKNYTLARNEFDIAHKNMSRNDKRYNEYNYYIGVVNFFEEKYLDAKSLFTTCTWESDLEPNLKQSSSEYLSKIVVDKPWSLIVPLGLTYDDNVLSLAQNQSLPSSYSSKSSWKTYMGEIFDYDTSLSTQNNGWFLGGESKTFYVKNLNSTYNSLDALVIEGSLFETKRWKDKDSQNSFKLYETNGVIYIDQLLNTYYVLAGIRYKYFDFNAGYNWDISEIGAEQKTSAFVFNQYYSDSYGQIGPLLLNMNSQLQEKITQNKTETLGNSLEAIASPSLVYPFSQKANISLTQTFDFTWTQADTIVSVYKFLPTLAYNYFLTQWLLGSVSGIYEYDRNEPGSLNVYRPQGTLSITGIF